VNSDFKMAKLIYLCRYISRHAKVNCRDNIEPSTCQSRDASECLEGYVDNINAETRILSRLHVKLQVLKHFSACCSTFIQCL